MPLPAFEIHLFTLFLVGGSSANEVIVASMEDATKPAKGHAHAPLKQHVQEEFADAKMICA